jgi:hypothetical protein
MEVATEWGFLFHQDPACFWDGPEWHVAQRMASVTVLDNLMKRWKPGG